MKALLVILSVIGAVLAVALALLLIWRVLATIQVSRLHIKSVTPCHLATATILAISHGPAALNAYAAFYKFKFSYRHNGQAK